MVSSKKTHCPKKKKGIHVKSPLLFFWLSSLAVRFTHIMCEEMENPEFVIQPLHIMSLVASYIYRRSFHCYLSQTFVDENNIACNILDIALHFQHMDGKNKSQFGDFDGFDKVYSFIDFAFSSKNYNLRKSL